MIFRLLHGKISVSACFLMVLLCFCIAGCTSKDIQLQDVSVKGVSGTMTIRMPFDFRNPMEPQTFPNGNTINSVADHNSDFEITINSIHYDREKYKVYNGKEFEPDLESFSKGMMDSFKKKFSATGGQLEDFKVAGFPAKSAVLQRTSKDIKLNMRFVTFFRGDELWCITIAYKAGEEEFDKAAERILNSIRFDK
ncbi:MAG: hypothetical protein K6C05_00595 [Anaerovibrio sp.]|uniref:hypothetical protein n=1 Tax=Anaerovibrio sp. TaxID=1872532 RepID=UPI0025F7F25C|nr:hypothetical protein [Anaerovibrio sp.]MCR5175326.1 hypothetical protein [Anaerovibrio sp.]